MKNVGGLHMKNIVSILIICLVSLTAISLSACTDETQGLLYEKIDGKKEYAVFDLGIAKSQKIVIPSEYNGLPVTAISDEAFKGTNITSIIIPDSVKEIGAKAFYDCRKLSSIRLPKDLEEIKAETFVNCGALEEIVIPDSVKTISASAFKTTGLKNLIIPNNVEYIGYESFYGCVRLESVIIGRNVNMIQPYAFYYCRNLKSATFVDSSNWTLTGIIFGEGNLDDHQKLASYLIDEDYCMRIWQKKND